jgi:hypothetical protein
MYNSVFTFSPHLTKTYFYKCSCSNLRQVPIQSLPLRFSDQNLVCISHFPHDCFKTHPFHCSRYHHIVISDEGHKLWPTYLFNFLCRPVTSLMCPTFNPRNTKATLCSNLFFKYHRFGSWSCCDSEFISKQLNALYI